MTKNILTKIGFTEHESAIYLALLELGPSSISELVRKTGIHRPTIYKLLPGLIEKSLVSIVPRGKYKRYAAESPDRLDAIFKDLEDDFNAEIHGLYEIYEARGKHPIITYAEGGKAITQVYSDMIHSLKKGETYYRYSSNSVLNREMYIPRDYRAVRDKKGLERLVITNESTKAWHRKKLGREVKAIPSDYDLFDYNIAQTIYGNKVALIDYTTKAAIVIESAKLAEFQKKIFKLLFKKL